MRGSFTEEDWLENFRMSKETFLYLCQELGHTISRQDTHMRKALPSEMRVAITLWRLGTNDSYRTVGHLFGVSRSSVYLIVKEVCQAIVNKLLPIYIRIPEGDTLKEVVRQFQSKYNFPQCIGAIDGSHIPIVAPSEFPADYYNRKGWHSVILQALVDHEYRFMNLSVGYPGRAHDARVLANSLVFQKAQAGTLLPDWKKRICGTDVPLVILGDPAYPLLPWLMKPFVDHGGLTGQQKAFNYSLSRARIVVENAFGRLKGRWRCLLKRNDTFIEDMPTVISACCVLHNICEVHRDHFNREWLQDIAAEPSQPTALSMPIAIANVSSATAIREALCDYVNQ